MYYLQSRYYSPEWGRFVNADATFILKEKIGNLLEHNLFSYCLNNPQLYSDPTGYDGESAQKGYEFMEEIYKMFPGFEKVTKSISTSFGNRIPDFRNSKVIGEIKNVKYQYLSSQIKGFLEIAKNDGKKFVLVVKEGTRLSNPLIKVISDNKGKILEVGRNGIKTRVTPLFFLKKQLEIFMRQYEPNGMKG